MLIDTFNLHTLRVFESVYRTLNMTKAASELGMTQSGVSQHIKHLEESLGVVFFDRVKHKLLPTDKARELAQLCQMHLIGLNNGLMDLTGKKEELSGDIFVGLPLEFGNNLVLPHLAKFGRLHPLVNFHIKYGHAAEMNRELLSGKLDFAFVDEFKVDYQVTTKKIREETLLLTASRKYFLTLHKSELEIKNTPAFYQSLDFVDYVEGAPVLRQWFDFHLKKPVSLRIRASLMDVQGMGRIITEGLGAGILPLHVVERLQKQGQELVVFPGSGKSLINPISMAFLQERTLSRQASQCMAFLSERLS
jgi:DNA-binding transcriptional LysR family regulator